MDNSLEVLLTTLAAVLVGLLNRLVFGKKKNKLPSTQKQEVVQEMEIIDVLSEETLEVPIESGLEPEHEGGISDVLEEEVNQGVAWVEQREKPLDRERLEDFDLRKAVLYDAVFRAPYIRN